MDVKNDKDEWETNLSASQKRGLISLVRRVKSGELVIVVTDKTSKFTILTMEDYLASGMVHASNARS